MRKALFVLVAVLALAPMASQARLGETQKTIEARMGKPVLKVGHAGLKEADGVRFVFHEPGWAVVITFQGGRSCHEQYYKISPLLGPEVVKGWFSVNGTYWEKKRSSVLLENLGRYSEALTTHDVAEVLTANSNGKGWKTRQAGSMWTSSDGLRQARYFLRAEDGEYLVVTATPFNRQLTVWEGAGTPPMWPLDADRLRKF